MLKTYQFQLSDNAALKLKWLLLASILLLVAFEPAFAAQNTVDPTTFLKKVIDLLTGTTATALAIIAVVIMGIGAMFGMFDFRKVGWFMVGIIMVFGAAWIVESITGATI